VAEDIGMRFATALLARDWAGVKAVLDPAVDFRAVTPNQFWEAETADDAVERAFSQWYESPDDAYEVLDIAIGRVAGRHRAVYSYRLRDAKGEYVAEQTAYFDTDAGEDRITKLRILCTGPVPIDAPGTAEPRR
jgi:hypothetical protein